jgi:hypothetical protein
MTHTHGDFECLSIRDYVDTKSYLAYEQNPYPTHRIWYKKSNKYVLESISNQVMKLRTDKKEQLIDN